MLSYTITDTLTIKLKEVSDLAAEWTQVIKAFEEEERDFIRRQARISNIGSTTRIENATLTNVEIDWLDRTLSQDGRPTAFNQKKKYIENKLSKEKERSIEEVAGCRNMLGIIYAQAEDLFPSTETFIRGLHSELMQFYPPAEHYRGRYKIAPNNVIEQVIGTNIRRDVLKTADPGPITEAAMSDLVRWYNQTMPTLPWAIAVATEFVFRFLAIHPFQDGNGRVGRGLFTLAILQSEDRNLRTVMPYIALDRHIEKNKEEYYIVLRKCSEGKFAHDPRQYKIGFFLEFILKMFKEAINKDIGYYHERFVAFHLHTDSVRKVLNAFKEYPETRLALKEVLNITELPRSTAIRALHDLVRDKFLQKTGTGPAVKYQLIF